MKPNTAPPGAQEQKRRRNGFLVSLSVHALFLLLLFGFTLQAPYPPPLEQGIAIQFGGESEGDGKTDRSEVTAQAREESQAESESTAEPAPKPRETGTPVATQDVEEAPSLRNAPAVTTPPKVDPNPIDKKGLYPGKQNPGKPGQPGAAGRQGSRDGQPEGGPQGDPRNRGRVGFNDFSLEGRGLLSFDRPEDFSQVAGVVVLNISVNLQGQVEQVGLNTKKSTISRPDIVEKCRAAARKFRFSKADNQSAPPLQNGSITFRFELN